MIFNKVGVPTFCWVGPAWDQTWPENVLLIVNILTLIKNLGVKENYPERELPIHSQASFFKFSCLSVSFRVH